MFVLCKNGDELKEFNEFHKALSVISLMHELFPTDDYCITSKLTGECLVILNETRNYWSPDIKVVI